MSRLRAAPGLRRVGSVVFRDRLGLVLWLGLVASYVFLWRLDLAITDSNVLANMLVSLAEGNLAVTEIRFPLDTIGSQRVQQGLSFHDGAYYGRNYGQVALAVPVLWGLRAGATFVDLRLLLAGGCSLVLLVLAHQIGVVTGAPRRGRLAGAVVAGLAFLASLGVATDVDARLLPVIALQLVNLWAAAGIGLVLYRLLGRFHGRRVGLAAGLATGLATPVAFWATFPKRHVLVALLLLTGVLSFAVSRGRVGGGRWTRGGAYAALGLIAWIHAFEGFVLVLSLAAADFATAECTDRRSVAIICVCLLVALSPTLATNAAVSGDPVKPPRLVGDSGDVGSDLIGAEDGTPGVGSDPGRRDGGVGESRDGSDPGSRDGGVGESRDGSDPGSRDGGVGESNDPADAGGDGSRGSSGDGVGGIIAPLIGLVPSSVRSALGFFARLTTEGFAALTEPDRLWHTFLRSENYEQFLVWEPPYQPYELSVLESTPLLGGIVGLPLAGMRLVRGRVTGGWPGAIRPTTARGQTDLLVAVVAVAFTIVYLSRLPLQAQLTVRYLFVLYPLGIYGLVRYRPIREAVEAAPRVLAVGTGVGLLGTLLGGVFLLSRIDPARAEAVQAHALVHLGLAVGLAALLVGRSLLPGRARPRRLALAVGLVAGATSGYYVIAGLAYFSGPYALDLARTAADLVTII